MAGDPAELAYGHALAMLGDPEVAKDVATTALRRAGRNRALVLAHAAQQAVARAADNERVDIASMPTAVLDLPALAATLASTRPPEERAALDVRSRTGGDLVALGAAFGTRPSVAADRCNEIADTWERMLDPALLAFSGPGECEQLAVVLGNANPETVAHLLDLAPVINAHVQDCTVCADRMRAMASVRSFFSAGAPTLPNELRAVSHATRRRRPAAAPAPLFGDNAPSSMARRFATWPSAALAGAAVALAITGVVVVTHRDTQPSAIARLTRLPSRDVLRVGVPDVKDTVARLDVRNPSGSSIRYRTAASAQWADVSPRAGQIPPHGHVVLTVVALDAAPEGDAHATLTITTSAGASTNREIVWTIERAPDLDAIAQGCAVDVHVVEEGDLASLVLHWRDTAEHEVDITAGPDGYQAQLSPEGQAVTYWVTAVDARGNQSRTADQIIPAGAC
jgi:hypothetical protein